MARMNAIVEIIKGDVRAASRLIRGLEEEETGAKATVGRLFPYTGRAHVIGVTGPPGAGKSTLTDALIGAFRAAGQTVGVLAVDPTSPFTGGAILGDRIRMQRHVEDSGVFIRSLATRGVLGGLARCIGDAVSVLDAMGKDVIIVETVGAGQQESSIIHHAHTTLVVLVPGMGDDIQAIKAGILEIADIFVINKADRDGVHQLARDLEMMLGMSDHVKRDWRPPILCLGNVNDSAIFSDQLQVLVKCVRAHYDFLVSSGSLTDRRRHQILAALEEAIRVEVLAPLLEDLEASGEMERMVSAVLNRESDPHTLAGELARRYLKEEILKR